MSDRELTGVCRQVLSALRFRTATGIGSGSVGLRGAKRGRPLSRANRALRAIRRVSLAESGQSMTSFVRGLTLVIVAVMGGVFGAIWLAERGGPLQQKVDALVRKVDPIPKQPSSTTPTAPRITVTVTETPAGPAPSRATASRPAPAPVPVRPSRPSSSPVKSALPSLQAVHRSSQAGRTTVYIELGKSTLAQAGRLHNPERVYFDLRDRSKPPDPPGRFGGKEKDDFGDNILAGVRMARSKPNLVRVVLDLKCSCDHSYRVVAKPSPRLVIDLLAQKAGSQAPAKPAKTAVQ